MTVINKMNHNLLIKYADDLSFSFIYDLLMKFVNIVFLKLIIILKSSDLIQSLYHFFSGVTF